MSKKRLMTILACFVLFGFATGAVAQQQAETPKDEKKVTTLGKYATAMQTYLMYRANPEKIFIVDVRTPEEYSFVGHAPMAMNIPSKIWGGKFDAEKKEYLLEDNPAFENTVKSKFKPDDTILVVCRSGQRSASAVNRLAKIGFTNAFSVVDGFEGEKVTDSESYYKGKRMKDGWKNAGLPWTYELDPKLVYLP